MSEHLTAAQLDALAALHQNVGDVEVEKSPKDGFAMLSEPYFLRVGEDSDLVLCDERWPLDTISEAHNAFPALAATLRDMAELLRRLVADGSGITHDGAGDYCGYCGVAQHEMLDETHDPDCPIVRARELLREWDKGAGDDG